MSKSVDAAIASAAEILSVRGVQFTALRRSIFALLCCTPKAMGAYDLLSAYERESERRTAPASVYRALDCLEQQGLVVHLASTHTYVARRRPKSPQTCLFFICSKCGRTSERIATQIERSVHRAARAIGFVAIASFLEVKGVCKRCSSDGKN
jgi:Fur family zinc uptake transcriptional regulator